MELSRTTGGVAEIRAPDDLGLARGLGFMHAHDRLVQLVLVRLAGQGRLAERLKCTSETLTIDVFMRQLGLARDAVRDVANCSPQAREYAQAYANGVNAHLERHRAPLELRLVGHRPEPWTVADTLLTIKLMSYVGLAQTQQDMEKLIIQAIHGGVSAARLKHLFAPHLDGLDDRIVGWIQQLRLEQPLLPPAFRFLAALPRATASNGWAVAPSRSATGHPLQCNDPHLEVNRLPAIWYEAVMHTDDDYRMGATMPGVPGLVMGRTRHLSFGFTYGFMDMLDYFIEECRDGRCRRGDDFVALETRTETILRKGAQPLEIVIQESDCGVLETDPHAARLADGLYLARAWSAHRDGASASLHALRAALLARTVAEAQEVLREVTISCNWVLADRAGAIGYQQSGLAPARRHSGLYPVPAWDLDLHWQGLVPSRALHSFRNPAGGFVVTANQEINPPQGPQVVNLPMAPYRAERIRALLDEGSSLELGDMKRIQLDLYSLQAERFMRLFQPHLPDTPAGRLLAEWDRRYDRDSVGASLFEDVYDALLRRVFGAGLFGLEAWDAIVATTPILADYFGVFDAALLGADHSWYGDEGRDAVLAQVLGEVLAATDVDRLERWGTRRRVLMTNIFFAGTLPRWLGFDHGPVELAGNRATVVQGGLFSHGGRTTTFAPSWRYVTDLGEDRIDTVLAGGPSARRTSRHYLGDVRLWLEGRYKALQPSRQG